MFKQNTAHRLLQCLCVAARPLRVEELAEILAIDFNRIKRGTPKINKDRRWDDPEQGFQFFCSSLIIVVNNGHSRVVQFSLFLSGSS